MAVKGRFVKKFVTNKEWKEWYSQDTTYADLGKVSGGRYVGFLIAGEKLPKGCLECNESDIKEIIKHRESFHIFPR